MAEDTAAPVVSNEQVATPVGDTTGTAVEQPQQQTEGAGAADETPVLELSAEQKEGWDKFTPEQKRHFNKIMTPKFQELSAERKQYEYYKRLAEALEADPDTTVELLARHRGFQVQRSQPANPTVQEQAVTDQHRVALEAQFGPDAANAIVAMVETLADKKAEARTKPLQDHYQSQVTQAAQQEVQSAVETLTKEFPDWKKYEPQMTQLAQKLQPGPGMSKIEFARILYRAANPGSSVQQTNAVIEKITKAAQAAEAPAQSVSTNRVAKARPKGLSFDKSMQAAAEAAARGELWED